MELAYGLGGLFIMGLGIRAVLQVAALGHRYGSTHGRPRGDRARFARALLLFGGRSAEHDVSRVTAVAVAKALDPRSTKSCPSASRPTGAGCWPTTRRRCSKRVRRAPAAFAVEGDAVRPPTEPGARGAASARRTRTFGIDVVLPMLHGPYGEDGTVQGLLELAGSAVRRRRRARLCGRHGQDHDEAGVRGRPGCRSPRTSRCATATTSRCVARDVATELGYPLLRQAVEHGLVGRRLEGTRPTELTGALARARVRRVGDRRGDGRRPRDRGRRARRRSAGRLVARRDRSRCGVLRLRRQVRGRRGEAARARAARRSRDRPRCAPRRARVRGVPVRGDGARRLLLRRARVRGERAEHDPRASRRSRCTRDCGRSRAFRTPRCSTGSSSSRSRTRAERGGAVVNADEWLSTEAYDVNELRDARPGR